MLNELRKLSIYVKISGKVDISPDAADNFLIEMAQAGDADYLVTGDKRDLLEIKRHGKTRIVTARQMVKILKL
jgi:predicted nucleic acid-binding protein